MIYKTLQKALFLLPPELSDDVGLYGLKLLQLTGLAKFCFTPPPDSPIEMMGLHFKNKVGIAAGLDVDGDFMHAIAALGVGHIEVGGVTINPQAGNPSPWLFRLPKYNAIINRKGFRNKGVDYLIENLKHKPKDCLIGVNVTKNKSTPLENAFDDYAVLMRKLNSYADYLTINFSSPNTPGLRDLQSEKFLNDLLTRLKALQSELPKYVPLVIKISPDMTSEELKHLGVCCVNNNIDGLIATNTTVSREKIKDDPLSKEQGGLSGAPLTQQATSCIKELKAIVGDKIPIIGSGGIMTAQDASDKFNAGATLVQVYTGLIYTGPSLISAIAS